MSAHPLEIPGHLTLTTGEGGLPKIRIESAFSRAEIYLHGAHVSHFQKHGEPPLLFMSAASEFAAGKPIRGGVPVIFPWFGPRDGYPAHGFARTTEWELVTTALLPNEAFQLVLHLPNSTGYQVEFVMTVGDQLSMELGVTNTSEQPFTFENCLHTYFHVRSISDISITGLSNVGYHDRIADVVTTEGHEPIRFEGEMDRVYFNTSATTEIVDPGLGRKIRIAKSGSQSTVVWNPWIAKSIRMPDFGDEEYIRMVCVESGNVADDQVTLSPGDRAVLAVVLSSESL
ncbi:MAG: D-hexose-6-phosphate mutarotase [Akkermansiaceae bacterium]|nr:D-hexose-6-phosphate mutarotase [Akkermansiaceae bacterium]